MKTFCFLVSLSAFLMLLSNQSAYSQLGVHVSGDGAGFSNTSGDFNTFLGDSAGYTNTTGLYNTFIGYRAGYSLSFPSFTQSDNTIIGAEAMGGNPISVSSTDNVIIGKRAGYNHYGTDAVIIGNHAGFNNENGADVVFIGEEAGLLNTSGDDNIFIGEDAGYNNTTASDNTFVGNQSGKNNSTGYRNAFFGNEAGWENTTGYRNTFLGDSAGFDVGIGHHNTFVGQASGSCTEHANYNTFVGSCAGWDNNRTNETNNANFNTYLGYKTGFTNREGQYNVLLGAMTDFSSPATTGNGTTNSYNIGIGYDALIYGERIYACVIGSNARVATDNSFVIGGTTAVNRMSVGIGTDSPNQNASLELAESNKGFLVSRMTDLEVTAFSSTLSASDEGMMVYDSTNNQIRTWDGFQWLSNENQTLDFSANLLSISNGNSVDLSALLDNTDSQELQLDGTDLSINNGNSVNLAAIQDGFDPNTDEQDLTGATLDETLLHISIENGSSVTVDLAPLLNDINAAMQDYQNRITQLETDLANLQALVTGDKKSLATNTGVVLYQNIPNPSNNTTRVQYFVPQDYKNVSLAIFDAKGITYDLIKLTETGLSFIDLDLTSLNAGTYFYSIFVDGQKAASKQMLVAK